MQASTVAEGNTPTQCHMAALRLAHDSVGPELRKGQMGRVVLAGTLMWVPSEDAIAGVEGDMRQLRAGWAPLFTQARKLSM